MPAPAHQQHLNNGSGASSSSFDASPPPPSSSSAAESAFPSTPPLVMPPFLGQGPYLQRGSSASIFHIIGTVAAATPPTSSAIASTGVDDDDDDSSVPSEGRSSEDGWVVSRVNENAADEQPSPSPPVNEHSNGNKEQATTKTEEVNDDIALDRRGSTRTRTTNGQTPHRENNGKTTVFRGRGTLLSRHKRLKLNPSQTRSSLRRSLTSSAPSTAAEARSASSQSPREGSSGAW